MVLLSVAVGIGYISINSFYIKDPKFYDVPIITCAFNALFGYFSIYLLLDAKRLEQKLGSFQEMAYYFTQDRAFIMLIGAQYGVNCMMISSYCVNQVVNFLSMQVSVMYDSPDYEQWYDYLNWFVIYAILNLGYYQIIFQ